MEWTEERVFRFIAAYKDKDVLWNQQHPMHYNRRKKIKAWEALAQETKLTPLECKKKMESLLSALRREKAKIVNSIKAGNGKDNVYRSTWFAFKSLQFLFDRAKRRQGLSTLLVEDSIDIEDTLTDGMETDNVLPTPLQPTMVTFPARPPQPQPPPSSVRRKRLHNDDIRLEKAFNMLSSVASASASRRKEDDECMVFGNFIGKKLQKYSPETQSAIQQAIMAIVFDADKRHYDRTASSNPPSIHVPHMDQEYYMHHQYWKDSASESPTLSHQSLASVSVPCVEILSSRDQIPFEISSPQTSVSGSEDTKLED